MFYHVLPTLPFKVSPCHPCAQAITGHHGQSAVSLVLDPASCRCRSMPKNGSLAKLHNDLCQLNKNTCFTKKTLGGPIVKLNIRKSASEMTITDSGAECTSSMVKFKGETAQLRKKLQWISHTKTPTVSLSELQRCWISHPWSLVPCHLRLQLC